MTSRQQTPGERTATDVGRSLRDSAASADRAPKRRRRGTAAVVLRPLALAIGLLLLAGLPTAHPSLAGTSPTSSQTFTSTGAPQTFTVPAGVTTVTIQAIGASGGQGPSGSQGEGASIQGDFAVTPNSTLTVLVGGAGGGDSLDGVYTAGSGAGGGGGSFVWTGTGAASATNLLIAAGGGGGNGGDATFPAAGTPPTSSDGAAGVTIYGPLPGGAGGTNGFGGHAAPDTYGGGGGGGGLLGDGGDGLSCCGYAGGGGGEAIANGGAGGQGFVVCQSLCNINLGYGGYGGGGGGAIAATPGASGYSGGGGGYNGGGGASIWSFGYGPAGGGGSYNGGTNQVNALNTMTMDGQVVISWTPPAVIPTVTSPTATGVTATTATLGGTVSNNGGATVTEEGVVYAPTATNANPQIKGTGVVKVAASSVSATGTAFTVPVTSLAPLTGYSFAAYATNRAGTGYSSVATFTTPKAGSSTVLTASQNPSQAGQTVTFTVGVSCAVSPVGGTVTLSDVSSSPHLLLGGATISGGASVFKTAALSAGAHSIEAVYQGNTDCAGSTSNALLRSVMSTAGGVQLASSANPSQMGSPVTFTATVSCPGHVPTGTVTFKDGSATLGSASVTPAGQASLRVTTLTGGSHTITAHYGGDTNCAAGTSAPLQQMVRAGFGG